MNSFTRFLIITTTLALIFGCASNQTSNDGMLDEFAENTAVSDPLAEGGDMPVADSGSEDLTLSDSGSDTAMNGSGSSSDEFSEFNNSSGAGSNDDLTLAESSNDLQKNDSFADSDLKLEDELAKEQKNEVAQQMTPAPQEPIDTAIPPAPDQAMDLATPAPAIQAPDVTETLQSSVPPVPAQQSSFDKPTDITNLKFQANDTGGTIVVEGNGPLQYTTRENAALNQFIVEVENARLPSRLKRSLNTKDIRGAIGTVDAYQKAGSNVARFVIQLRKGANAPVVQVEGNNLLIVSSPDLTTTLAQNDVNSMTDHSEINVDLNDDKILSSQNLADFLAGNTKFYGKKISIEMNNMEVKEALKFITEESGVNLVISDDVKGAVSLKLRQVPWDQALVVLMKARKLGYSRQGSVLRIGPLADFKQEEDDAAKFANARKNFEPLKVRMFPISYAKVDELEKKIKEFLSEKGKVVGDVRTSSLVVTDNEESLGRVAKLVASLDVQPPQVLIEAKIVEASENFIRNVGVSWSASGGSIKIGGSSRGPVNMQPTLGVNPGGGSGGNLNFGVNIGTLDILGNLTAALALSERDEQVKVISSPRILTLSNEKSGITQTTEVPIKTITYVNNTQQETYQFKPLTMKLDVTPQVTSDASVIMNVEVNRQFAGASVSNTSEAFSVNSREAKTKVLVKNGQTAVIGGIYQSDATDGEQGVPGLKNLPIVGSLFSVSNKRKQKIELVIFLTPRILSQADGVSASPTTQDF